MALEKNDSGLTGLQRWVRQPQKLWLRRAVFQVHLWSGVCLGFYILFISLTGSVLVYRNELYAAATSQSDLRLISALIDLHADLLTGSDGRRLNGIGAFAVLLSGITGLVIWWPGVKRWRRSLTLKRGVNWKRWTWDLHSAVGIWSVGFILIFAVSGIYLSFPGPFQELADRLDSGSETKGGFFFNNLLSWLAYSHFGRINGIGISCSGPGFCDQAIKAVWALFGMAPTVLFVSGSIMWWNHVVRPWRRRTSNGTPSPTSR